MRRQLVTIVVLTAAVAVVAGGAAGQAGGPFLTVEQARIDLGEIRAGADAVATFVFHNSGPADVRILRAKPS
ncbi:MAG TPA: hypothetical protein VLB51_12160 [Methylomirabilota bacterium]|nr:hypothetical protein [Methylomirabilota bacterium]